MKRTSIIFIVIVVLVMAANLINVNWGLPNKNHIYSYNCDETTYLSFLKNMNPSKYDFDPKVYWKTHLTVYYTGAVLKLGELCGLYSIGNKKYYKAHPEQFGKVILWQRIFWGKIPLILLAIVSFFLGRTLIDEKYGLILAGVTGLLPTLMVNSNYAVENIVIPLLLAATCYLSLRYYEAGRLKYIVWAGIITGLAVSTKQTGVLGFVFILGALISKRKKTGLITILKYFIISGIAATLAFSITSPYYMKFLILRVLAPASIQPDIYGDTTMPVNMLSLKFFGMNFNRIFKINFVQLGGALLLLSPFGVYFYRKQTKFRIIFAYAAVFYVLSLCCQYSSDSRLTPLAYFMAVLGTAGGYYILINSKSRLLKSILVTVVAVSLFVYAGVVTYPYIKPDIREISSAWIEEHILKPKRPVSIGLHESPWYAAPDILTKEWMHNIHPEDSIYTDIYDEIFVISDEKVKKYGVRCIYPKESMLTETNKMKWLESQSPDYIILSHEIEGWPEYFDKSEKYKLVKHFRGYDILSISNLCIYSFDVYVFKSLKGASGYQNKI